MTASEIEGKAAFSQIRYAQLWEDADVLTQALGSCSGGTLVSICSAGDNALAMLTLDPAHLVALDLSEAQLNCLRLRMGAYRNLDHSAFLELMGARPSQRRGDLLATALTGADEATTTFWNALTPQVIAHGAGGVGKFEKYFRIFRKYLLPLVHSRKTIDAIFEPRDQAAREAFFTNRLNTWRWRMLINFFFSRPVMARMGRDKAFFDHVEGSVAAHVHRRIRHAGVDCDPSQNPYLHWIMKEGHGAALPMPWRAEHFETIRDRLDRVEIRLGSLEEFISSERKADGFNLSDIFEYMSPDVFKEVYGSILSAANPGARLVYWNMMAPRRVPPEYREQVTTCSAEEDLLKTQDKAFFYSDFVIEETH